eukprot:6056957-Amphidinium_carterae.1
MARRSVKYMATMSTRNQSRDEDVEDDEFLEDLAELDRLAQHLNRGHAAAGGADAENGRPASGPWGNMDCFTSVSSLNCL